MAEFDIDYVDFIRNDLDINTIQTARPFLRMREHGAFFTNAADSMRTLGHFILGFVLQYGTKKDT